MAVDLRAPFTPEERAAMLEPAHEIRRRFAEAERNECVLRKPEVVALVNGGYAAACDGKLIGWASTWEELRARLHKDGWFEHGDYPIGLVLRKVGVAVPGQPRERR
ncbi:MAG: hypothetical protein ACKVVT_16515 [Dehalococcoidia bacterium]